MFLQASRKHGLHSSQTNGLSPEWTRMLVSRCWAWENDFENFYQAMAFLQNLQISSIWIRIEKYFEHSLQHMSESQTGAGNLNLHALENTTFFTGICLQKMASPQKGLLPRNSFSPKMTYPQFSQEKRKWLLYMILFRWYYLTCLGSCVELDVCIRDIQYNLPSLAVNNLKENHVRSNYISVIKGLIRNLHFEICVKCE